MLKSRLLPAFLGLSVGWSNWSFSSWETWGDFLLSISAVLFAVPAAKTDFGEEFLILLPCTTSSHSSSPLCRMVFWGLKFCPPKFLSVHLPFGLKSESFVHRKRTEESDTHDLHRNDLFVKKAEGPWQKINRNGFWHILTFKMIA